MTICHFVVLTFDSRAIVSTWVCEWGGWGDFERPLVETGTSVRPRPSVEPALAPRSAKDKEASMMDVHLDLRTEPMGERDRSRLRPLHPLLSRLPSLPPEDLAHEDPRRLGGCPGVTRKGQPQSLRIRHHPLSIRRYRQYAVHPVQRRVAHPPPKARRAKCLPLARERDQNLIATVIAGAATEAFLQDAQPHHWVEGPARVEPEVGDEPSPSGRSSSSRGFALPSPASSVIEAPLS